MQVKTENGVFKHAPNWHYVISIFSPQISHEDPAETLYNVNRQLCAVTLQGFMNAGKFATFKDIVNEMLKVESNEKYREIIQNEFERRLVFDDSVKPRPYDPFDLWKDRFTREEEEEES